MTMSQRGTTPSSVVLMDDGQSQTFIAGVCIVLVCYIKKVWVIFNSFDLIGIGICLIILLADCGPPKQIQRTTIKGLEGGTLEGTTIMYICDDNTDPSGNPSSVCTEYGIWSNVTIKCTRK